MDQKLLLLSWESVMKIFLICHPEKIKFLRKKKLELTSGTIQSVIGYKFQKLLFTISSLRRLRYPVPDGAGSAGTK